MKPKLLRSSSDPTQWSLTIKSILLALVPLIMTLSGAQEAELMPIIDSIGEVVFYLTSLLSALGVIYGGARKIINGRWSA